MPLLAHVTTRALFGGVVGSAGTSDISNRTGAADGVTMGATDAPMQPAPKSSGSGRGILWVMGVAVLAFIVYALVSTGSPGGAAKKMGRNMSEMTGGLIGKKPKDDDHSDA